jgi:hypothetical protein
MLESSKPSKSSSLLASSLSILLAMSFEQVANGLTRED